MSASIVPTGSKDQAPHPFFWFFEAIVGWGDYISAAVWPICQMTILKNENNVKWLIPVKIRVNCNERISVCIFVVWCYGYFWYLYHILWYYRQSDGIIRKGTIWANKYPLIWFSALIQIIWLDNLQRKENLPKWCLYVWDCAMCVNVYHVLWRVTSGSCCSFIALWYFFGLMKMDNKKHIMIKAVKRFVHSDPFLEKSLKNFDNQILVTKIASNKNNQRLKMFIFSNFQRTMFTVLQCHTDVCLLFLGKKGTRHLPNWCDKNDIQPLCKCYFLYIYTFLCLER